MPAARLPADEAERLAALHGLELLDTPPDPDFDLFIALASNLFGAPMAAVSLVDEGRQWFKASIGLTMRETPRASSFCAHAILQPEATLVVPDTLLDPRFANNPLVTGAPGLRFYAGTPILDTLGHPLGAICVMDRIPREVPEQWLEQLRFLARGVTGALALHHCARSLHLLASTDALTGTANRAGFEVEFHRLLAEAAQGGGQTALMMLDLDHFKAVNDLFGHDGGDAALREVAGRIRQVLRGQDLVGRLHGDEFCVALRNVEGPAAAQAVAARIHAALADSFVLDGSVVPLRTSIGIAIAPADGTDMERLLARADAALYRAKALGRGTTALASTVRPRQTGAVTLVQQGRSATERLLRAALFPPGHEPFSLRYQPYFAADGGWLLGFEALVRWPLDGGRELAPDAFIPVAEASGLVAQIDHWVLRQACREAVTWPSRLTISTNLAAANFLSDTLAEDVGAILAETGLPGRRLKVEITESALLHESERVRETLRRLQAMEVRVALDDFGTGHASLAYLRDYPVDEIKIDRSFVQGADQDPRTRAFLQAIIDMGAALGVPTLAEGVETESQLALLQSRGVGAVQGFLLGRPMVAEAARALIMRQLGLAIPA